MKGFYIMKTIRIQEVIKEKRTKKNLSQEALADAFGISVQAVSKWETGLSYPDITVLPRICDYFNINMDALFYGEEEQTLGSLPDDDKYRVVQCIGNKVISHEEYDSKKKIKLLIPNASEKKFDLEVWGSADIDGDIKGNVNAGGGVNCGNIGGFVQAKGGGVNCGNIGGHLEAQGGVNCGSIGSYLKANGGVNSGHINGDASCDGSLNCGTIKGNATAQKIKCKKVEGNLINCDKVIIKKIDDDED